MYLEGGGGGNGKESYELAAYFYSKHTKLNNTSLPFFFITGDEFMYDELTKKTIKHIIGEEEEVKSESLPSAEIWKGLMEKYNVFYLHKYYRTPEIDEKVVKQWSSILGSSRVLQMTNPKACVDVMLGILALTSSSRTLPEYINDMKIRGQDA